MAAAVAASWPAVARGDAGTPLLFAGAFHLLIGNGVIGAIEAAVVARVFSLRFRSILFRVLLANYVSCISGFVQLMAMETRLEYQFETRPIATGRSLLVGLWIVSFVISAAVEWPFFLWVWNFERQSQPRILEVAAGFPTPITRLHGDGAMARFLSQAR